MGLWGVEYVRLVPALRDLLEVDGDAIDYASLSVRHLGNILENVMEFSILQVREDVMLLEKNSKIIPVKTSKESNYSQEKRLVPCIKGWNRDSQEYCQLLYPR